MTSRRKQIAYLFVFAVLFLFFFQLLAEFFEALYAFGLLGTAIPPEIATVVVLFSPLLLLPFKAAPGPKALTLFALLAVLARQVQGPLGTQGKMLVSGLGLACFLLFLAAYLGYLSGRGIAGAGVRLAAALALALALSIFLRSLNAGSDLSLKGMFQLIGWALALPAILLLPGVLHDPALPQAERPLSPARFLATAGLTLGLVSVFVLLYFAFTSPVVLSRWTGGAFPVVVAVLVAALAALFWLAAAGRLAFWRARRTTFVLLTAFFGLALASAALAHQVRFPASPGDFPLPAASPGAVGQSPLFLALLLAPILLVDFALLLETLVRARPSMRTLAFAFGLGGLYFTIMVLGHVFTTTYDYIPVVGPLFRDQFWLLHLVAALALALFVWLGQPARLQAANRWSGSRAGRGLAGLITLLGLASVLAILLTQASPPAPPSSGEVTVMSYNILQGYSEAGRRNYDGQLAVVRELAPHILGLQETDNARLSGGNADVVRYMADRLDMHSYYGPKSVNGTFGVALLSRYPIEEAQTYYLYSEGEQVAVIEAQVTIQGRTYRVYVNHLGNGGPLIQQQQFLQLAAGQEQVIAVGDYNFRPDTEPYRLTTETLADAWLLQWPSGVDDQGQDKSGRIDHIFVSPDLAVTQAGYVDSPASDHPAAYMIFAP